MSPERFHKHRHPASPGSIPDRLQMFSREVRFYREVADHVGVRVPQCYLATLHQDGSTDLELEDLGTWDSEAAPDVIGALLRELHGRWAGKALARWPWLKRADASDLVQDLYQRCWPELDARSDLPRDVRELGERLVGRVIVASSDAAAAGPPTLVHGDASLANMRVSAQGEVALLDWEDFDWAPGVLDLSWHLMSSRAPTEWEEVISAYGDDRGIDRALPAVAVQALLSLTGCDEDTAEAAEWIARLSAASQRVAD